MRPAALLPAVLSLFASPGCDLVQQARDANVDRRLSMTAEQANKGLPKMVDADTRWEKASAMPGKVFRCDYTMVGHRAAEFDQNRLRTVFLPQLIQKLRTNPALEEMRSLRITFVYSYVDESGKPIKTFTITPAEYGK